MEQAILDANSMAHNPPLSAISPSLPLPVLLSWSLVSTGKEPATLPEGACDKRHFVTPASRKELPAL